MRVVFDTNVLVSVFALPGGRGDEALRKIVEGEDSLVLSRPILDGFLSVLARKLAQDREALARVAIFLSELGRDRRADGIAGRPCRRARQPNSGMRARAGAQAIATGDRAMLAHGEYGGTRIVSLSTYLA